MLRQEHHLFSPDCEVLLLCKSTGRVMTLPYKYVPTGFLKEKQI